MWFAGGRNTSGFDLTGTSYVEFKDLNVTDHSGHDYYDTSAAACQNQGINSVCASNGFVGTGGGWHHLKFSGVNIHGFRDNGFWLSGGGASSPDIAFEFIDSKFTIFVSFFIELTGLSVIALVHSSK